MKQLYEIRPIRPIREPGKPYIGRAKRLYLEIEEVKYYMNYGPVYRIFENTTNEPVKVTGSNILELHGSEEKSSNEVVSAPEVPVVEDVKSVDDSAPLEEVETNEDISLEETKSEDVKNLPEEECSTTNDENTASSVESVVENDTVEEQSEESISSPVTNSSNPWNNSKNYNKHNNKHKR